MWSIASLKRVPTAREVKAIRMSSYIDLLKHGRRIIPRRAKSDTITIAIEP